MRQVVDGIFTIDGHIWRICTGPAELPIVAKCFVEKATLVARGMSLDEVRAAAAKKIAAYKADPLEITKYEDIP